MVVVWQNSLSSFCGLSSFSRCGYLLNFMVVPFAIRTDSRPMRPYEAIYRCLLKEKNWQHIGAIKDRASPKILLE